MAYAEGSERFEVTYHGTGYGHYPPLRDLGPKQIEWLKANVPQFGPAKEAADRAIAHAAEVARQIEGRDQ